MVYIIGAVVAGLILLVAIIAKIVESRTTWAQVDEYQAAKKGLSVERYRDYYTNITSYIGHHKLKK